jgi:acetyl-CoA synthetase
MSDIVWRPSQEYVERANITRFMRANDLGSYTELVNRSRSDVEWFWDAVVTDVGIEFYEPYTRVLDTSDGIPWARWFTGGSINLAHNCLDRWAERTPDKVAVAWEGEEGEARRVTYAELLAMTNRLANGLR